MAFNQVFECFFFPIFKFPSFPKIIIMQDQLKLLKLLRTILLLLVTLLIIAKFQFISSLKSLHSSQYQKSQLSYTSFQQYIVMSQRFNTLGITRKRYDIYLKAKGKQVMAKKRFSKTSLRKKLDEDDIIKTTLLSTTTKASQIQLAQMSEEPWRNDYQSCCMLLQEVDELQEDIRLERAKKLTAMNQAKHIRTIEKLHEQASWKITSCEKILKKMGSTGGYEETPQQKKLFSNIIMSLAMKIREKAKSLRESQQLDLKMAKQLKQFNLTRIQDTNLMLKDDESEEFDQQQFQALEHKLHEERNQQILKIVASIHSLNTLYRQLQTVVIEQGSLLDRIDQNLDVAAENIKQANVHLTKAQQHQKSPLANRVICILIASIMICLLILWMRS